MIYDNKISTLQNKLEGIQEEKNTSKTNIDQEELRIFKIKFNL